MYLYKKGQTVNNVLQYYKQNYIGISGLALITLMISYYSGKHYINSLLTILISTFVTWLGHFLLHHYNTWNPIAWIHEITHHSPFSSTILGKFIEYVFVEFVFFGGGILLLVVIFLHRILHYYILNPYVILFWSIAVPYIHEVHYHILNENSFHKFHHLNPEFNYSPDYWDVITDRKQDNTPIENEMSLLPHLLIISVIVICIINTKYDFIKYFSK